MRERGVFIDWPRSHAGDSRRTGADGGRADGLCGFGSQRKRRNGCDRHQRCHRYQRARRYYRGGGGGAAAAAAFAGIVGTGLAIAAAQNRRDYYDSYGYYGGGPVYYGGGPYYYGDGYYGGYRSSVPYYRGHPNAGW